MDESIVKHLDQPAKTLKLSEAIRIGARMKPQCREHYYINGGSCVWGAAADALGESAGTLHNEGFPEAHAAFVKAHGLSMMDANDHGGWSREQIADSLQSLGF